MTRERERRTLVGLLALPTDRAAVVNAKWLGGVLRFRLLGACLAAVWTGGLLTGALHPAAVPLLALAIAVHLAFVASLGGWLSLVCRKTLWAYLGMALVLLLIVVGPWAELLYNKPPGGGWGGQGWGSNLAQVGLDPPRTWWFLEFGWTDFRELLEASSPLRAPLGTSLAGLGCYAAAAGVLWLLACWRFRREQASAG
jgi:hypothetical protein